VSGATQIHIDNDFVFFEHPEVYQVVGFALSVARQKLGNVLDVNNDLSRIATARLALCRIFVRFVVLARDQPGEVFVIERNST
jgi:hypothetical protein